MCITLCLMVRQDWLAVARLQVQTPPRASQLGAVFCRKAGCVAAVCSMQSTALCRSGTITATSEFGGAFRSSSNPQPGLAVWSDKNHRVDFLAPLSTECCRVPQQCSACCVLTHDWQPATATQLVYVASSRPTLQVLHQPVTANQGSEQPLTVSASP